MTQITRQTVVDTARGWLGTRWRHQGRTREGIDCIGLPVVITQALKLTNYDVKAYGREPNAVAFLPHFTKAGAVRIDPKKAGDGDLIAFHQKGYPCHCGIRSTRNGVPHVIHASMKERKVVEEPLRPEAPIVAVFHMPGVAE